MLRVPIPVIAPSLVWIGVIGNLKLALRHPQDNGPPRTTLQDFARQLLANLIEEPHSGTSITN